MKDPGFIQKIITKGEQAKEKVLGEFSTLSKIQFNWQAAAGSWSIAQCLDHLFISDSAYFSYLQKIAAGSYKMSFLQKYNPLTPLWGGMMVSQLGEQPRRKMKTNAKLFPSAEEKETEFINVYLENLDTLLKYFAECKNADIDKTVITSPFVSIITYNLRDAFQFLVQHEHRHINQAVRVKHHPDFITD